MSSLVDRTVVRLKDFRAGDVSSLADQWVGGARRVGARARGVAMSSDALVRSSPWQTAGAFALVGLAAGILVARAARRSRIRAQNESAFASFQEVGG